MIIRLNGICISLCLICLLKSNVVTAAPVDNSNSFFTFTFENDVFVGEDDGYTNGTGITFGTSGIDEFSTTNVPGWIYWLIKDLYISTDRDKKRGISHMFFQRMQTPVDINETALISNDLPYAGLLAWQGTAYSWDDMVADQMSLYLGWVGPAALAEQSQKGIHQIIGSDEPMGWHHQISNEPIVKVELQRIWSLYRNANNRFQYDVLGLGGAGLGNLETATKGGIALRWGTNLSASVGAFSLQADSPSIPLEHFQNEISAGALWSRNRWAYVFALSSSSSRTELTDERENYGAISATYRH